MKRSFFFQISCILILAFYSCSGNQNSPGEGAVSDFNEDEGNKVFKQFDRVKLGDVSDDQLVVFEKTIGGTEIMMYYIFDNSKRDTYHISDTLTTISKDWGSVEEISGDKILFGAFDQENATGYEIWRPKSRFNF